MNNYSGMIPVVIGREGKKWIAYSPHLELATSADSREEVQSRFKEIADIFMEEIIEMGTVDEVFSGLGRQKINNNER